MKIIVDSGSTKADWIFFDDNGKWMLSVSSLGLNPEVLTVDEFASRVMLLPDVKKYKEEVKQFYFYGSGCGSTRAKQIVYDFFENYFVNATYVEVREDTYAAVYATTSIGSQAIVCINGTGSNCSYFDGSQVHQAVESLGYLAMDDCSGSAFGRLMIRGYYLKMMPEDLRKAIALKYDLHPDVVKDHFYKKENPNAYLASFLPFLIQHKDHPYFQAMIVDQIQFFVDYYIKQFTEAARVPIHFIGSIGYFLQEEFSMVLKQNNLELGKIYQKPMDGLIEFHQQKI
ncbi:N-acetylglucosamine kinase [Flavobacterium sp. NKUCC04_CG]|uniref:N-acetylglucosamine kinase n=1 Tax=Flavobacterium sp. NKUCC04_CG TaxID=2842121 RepID=UPI001C5BAD6C|nr:N-acetylglucosamine kinase [Flavobacterium sp. NKUCC04_CG]MBW3517969.1 N-acetylglucosamine kinase [Flavobacterium sp. NKUCC04_CG]